MKGASLVSAGDRRSLLSSLHESQRCFQISNPSGVQVAVSSLETLPICEEINGRLGPRYTAAAEELGSS